MKTTREFKAKGLKSRSELLSTEKAVNTSVTGGRKKSQPSIDPVLRRLSRRFGTSKVLNLLSVELSEAHAAAEVVGNWVWVRFERIPAFETRQHLSQFGFHWNRRRGAWQHPCGVFSIGSKGDPRAKYQTHAASQERGMS